MQASTNIQLSPLESAIKSFTTALYDGQAFQMVSKEEIRDALSSGQLMSKKWLLDNLYHITSNVTYELRGVVVGGWTGMLAHAIEAQESSIKCDSLDIDPQISYVAERTLMSNRGHAYTADMYEVDYQSYQLVVNTSGEHIADLSAWVTLLSPGTYVVVQSNNARHIDGHINCVDSAEELREKLGLREVFYADELVFPMYTRYMIVGRV